MMAKYAWRIGKIPNGAEPAVGVSAAVRKLADGSTITSLISDAEGFVRWSPNGHPEPFYLAIENVPGGSKFWRSDVAITAGPLCLYELPVAFRVLGEGVIRGFQQDLAVSLVGGNGPSLSVAPGGANVIGHPVVIYTSVGLSNSRPSSGVRIDRVIIRLYPEGSATTPGKADIVLQPGTIDAGAPALTQTSTVHEVSLYQVSVPVAGAITLTDERTYSGELPMVTPGDGAARGDLVTTSSPSGEALAGLAVLLDLPRTAIYNVEADFSAVQADTVGALAWMLLGTFGSLGSGNNNFNTPGQIAVDSSGNVYIADTGNNRLIKRNSSGTFVSSITGLTGITGVAVDSSGNVYVTEPGAGDGAIKKYTSSFVLQWANYTPSTWRHLATDGTHLFVTISGENRVYKVRCSDGAFVTSWGSAGTGNGQYNTPYGICMALSGNSIFVVDSGNNRIQRIGTGGTFIEKWGSAGSGDGQFSSPRGVAIDAAGQVWVADYGNDRLQRFTELGGTYQQTISQANPNGIDVATGDVLWASNADGDTIAKWDEVAGPGGYGQIAIEIDGNLGAYIGAPQQTISVSNVHAHSVAGPGTCLVRAFGKATADTMTLRSAVLSARATPDR